MSSGPPPLWSQQCPRVPHCPQPTMFTISSHTPGSCSLNKPSTLLPSSPRSVCSTSFSYAHLTFSLTSDVISSDRPPWHRYVDFLCQEVLARYRWNTQLQSVKTSFHEGSVHRGKQEEIWRTSSPGRLAPSFVTLSPGGTRRGHDINRARMGAGTLGVLVLGGAVAVGWQPCRTVAAPEEQMPTLLPSSGLLQVHPFGQIQPGVGGIQSMELRRKRTEQVGETERTDLPLGAKGDDAAPHYSASSPSGPQTGPSLDVSTACPLL